jgi:pilus assembly protein CpaC
MSKTKARPSALAVFLVVLIAAPALTKADSEGIPIEVQVEVTEVDNLKATNLGIEWLDQIGVSEKEPGLVAIGKMERVTNLQANLHALIQEGAAELLANPNLITNSGTTATFQAGGEIPYITNSSLGSTHVEFKSYGVVLNVKPELLEDGQIQVTLRASVSSPDQTNGVSLSGNSVPALLERSVTSHVAVNPGTTMTLAGLVQTHKDETVSGVPILRRIPLLGALFRWRRSSFRKTTIIMFVTPRVVQL